MRDEALRFVEMLGDGRVELVVQRNPVWTSLRSYRDGLALPFRKTSEPWLEPALPHRADPLRLRVSERQADSTRASGEILMPGPIVDDVVMPLRYRPFEAAGLARMISSSTAP